MTTTATAGHRFSTDELIEAGAEPALVHLVEATLCEATDSMYPIPFPVVAATPTGGLVLGWEPLAPAAWPVTGRIEPDAPLVMHLAAVAGRERHEHTVPLAHDPRLAPGVRVAAWVSAWICA